MLTLPLGGVKKYNEAFRVAVLEKRRENLKLNVVLVIETKALYYWKRGGGGEKGRGRRNGHSFGDSFHFCQDDRKKINVFVVCLNRVCPRLKLFAGF